MFGGLKNKLRSAEAAALIESAFEELAKQGRFQSDPQKAAFSMVKNASESQPALFDGRNGHRPHRIAYAALVLAMNAERAPVDSQLFKPAYDALAMILTGIEDGMMTHPFSPQDLQMIEVSKDLLQSLSTQREAASSWN